MTHCGKGYKEILDFLNRCVLIRDPTYQIIQTRPSSLQTTLLSYLNLSPQRKRL